MKSNFKSVKIDPNHKSLSSDSSSIFQFWDATSEHSSIKYESFLNRSNAEKSL
ncbi:hypothetical protein LEP1GSC068_0337 [Leptospira sp. Fiocruz LV3954]|nr:hypothetical protein LEP1GSC068_0337 [Leptospira sp. Fiocruz LV3954]EMI60782.1 hypothetical protein LEP1GSC076_2696 [Leptospira sp. Fiocruz LV4135]